MGGYINAYTSREVTAYYRPCAGARCGLALDVIADILRNPVFDPREIEVERHVILQEIGQAATRPTTSSSTGCRRRAYPGQPLGRTILGDAGAHVAASPATISPPSSRHYGPGQMIVSAAGAVDHDTRSSRGRARCSAIIGPPRRAACPPTPRALPAAKCARQVRSNRRISRSPSRRPATAIRISTPPRSTASRLAGHVLAPVPGNSRTARAVLHDLRASGAYADTGMTTIYAGTSGAEMAELAELTVDEMKRIAEG